MCRRQIKASKQAIFKCFQVGLKLEVDVWAVIGETKAQETCAHDVFLDCEEKNPVKKIEYTLVTERSVFCDHHAGSAVWVIPSIWGDRWNQKH